MIHWLLHDASRLGARALGDGSLTVAERARLGALPAPKRRGDWAIGRVAAKAVVVRALTAAGGGGWCTAQVEVASEASGRPFARLALEAAPCGGFVPGQVLPVAVSISHAERHALCAAAVSEPLDALGQPALGVDLALVEPRSPAFLDTFFTVGERRYVLDGPAAERDLRANVIWCAKEAVLKTLGVGLAADTFDVACSIGRGAADEWRSRLEPEDGEWHPFVARCGSRLVPGTATLHGAWRTFGAFVGAVACSAPPAAARRHTANASPLAGASDRRHLKMNGAVGSWPGAQPAGA